MITLYKEYTIGVKMLSDAELERESSPSGQTHIGLSEKVLTYLPNTPIQQEGILVVNQSCSFVECAFSKINNKRSTKVDSLTTNPVKSVVKQIRNIASNADIHWFLVWFALENQTPVFWLLNDKSEDYEELSNILEKSQNLSVYTASKEEYFVLLSKVRSIKKLQSAIDSKYNVNQENRLIAVSSEHRTFVHLCMDYYRQIGQLDKMLPYFNTEEENVPITVQHDGKYKLLNMFMFADIAEIQKRNSTKNGRRWYTDPFVVNGRNLYLYVDWFPGKDSHGKDTQLMIPDFVQFVSECFGQKYVYRNAQGTHEMWEINNPETFEVVNNFKDNELTDDSDYVKFKHLLEYFCAHLQYFVSNDKTINGYDEYLKPLILNGSFKYSGQGWKGQNIQKQIDKWQKYTVGRVCFNVYGSNPKAVANYINWEGTGHNVIANWSGNLIANLQLIDYVEEKGSRLLQKMKFTQDELGLYDGKEPNENLKKFYDAFADMLKNNPEQEEAPEELHVEPLTFADNSPRQIIYYGAPGTGKSHTIKKEEEEGLTCIRTTFHPDSDYSTFVGCYKPHKCRETATLTYEFVPQAFLEAYTQAWQNPQKEIALVIEEINRGNCAQIFGDIFQLLDRDEDGWSTYPIKSDTDIAEYLEQMGIAGYPETLAKRYGQEKTGYGFMALPPNMSILATMNTSDQSLFPIDSAFKRRWDWKYIPICQGKSDGKGGVEKGLLLDWKIETLAGNNRWWNFLRAINGIIESTTHSEDKELGFFFCKANKDGVITADKFVNKVVFYLWTDVFKTYGFRSDIFNKDEDGQKKLAFKDFFNDVDGTPNEETVKLFVENVMKHLPKENVEK